MVQTLPPSSPLAPFVRRYQYRVCEPGAMVDSFISPARLTQFCEFYLEDQYEVEDLSQSNRFRAAPATLVGLQAVAPIRLNRVGRLRNFTIVFRPTAFHELFQLPMQEIAGTSVDLEAVCLQGLRERLGQCSSFEKAVEEAERTLRPFVHAAEARRSDPCRWLRSIMAAPHTGAPLDDWLVGAPFGARQVQRLFLQQVGVSPKRYWRVRRFETAVRLRREQPESTWGEIAAELGYHDQMHLVHDFRELAGAAPNLVLSKLSDSY